MSADLRHILMHALADQDGNTLHALNKADTGDIADAAVESLGRVGHIATWGDDSRAFATTLKLLPVAPAVNVEHKEVAITDWGLRGRDVFGAITESGVPSSASPTRNRQTVYLKPFAEAVKLTSLAQATQVVPMGDMMGNSEWTEHYGAMMRLTESRAIMSLHWDTRQQDLAAADGLCPMGLFQLIEENTSGYDGGAFGGTQIIDLEGAVLTPDVLTAHLVKVGNLRGRMPSGVTLPPQTINAFQSQLTANFRGTYGQTPIIAGSQVVGINVEGQMIPLLPDTYLSWERAYPLYRAPTRTDGPPAPTFSASAGAVSGSEVSLWNAEDAGNVFYVVCAISTTGVRGTGVRYPSSTSSYVAVAEGEKVTLTITPADSSAMSFAIYRGVQPASGGSAAATTAGLIGYVAADGGSAVTFEDLNQWRPFTDRGLALPFGGLVFGQLQQAVASGTPMAVFNNTMNQGFAAYSEAAQLAMGGVAAQGAGVKRHILGPALIRVEQGKLGLSYANYVIGQATAPSLPGAQYSLAFINLGRPAV